MRALAQGIGLPLGSHVYEGVPLNSRTSSLLKTPYDDLDGDLELYVRDRGSIDSTPRIAELDPESCDLLGVPLTENRALITLVCDALASVLKQGHNVEVMAFGTFRLRTYRPLNPPLLGDYSFVEAPYGGPLEFIPSATLLRQLETEQLDSSQAPRCDQLYSMLRDDPRLPRAKVPLLIKLTFRGFLEVLLAHQSVLMPHIGQLVVQRRPNTFRLDVHSGEMMVRSGLKTVLMHPLASFAEKLPGMDRHRGRQQSTLPVPDEQQAQTSHPVEGPQESQLDPTESPSRELLDVDEPEAPARPAPVLQVFVADDDDVLKPVVEEEPDSVEPAPEPLSTRPRAFVPDLDPAPAQPAGPLPPLDEDDDSDLL